MSPINHYKYKKSGLDWIETIPEHWSVMPNRALFIESNIKDQTDEQLLSITIANGIITQSELLNHSSKKDSSNTDKSNYKLVEPNDIAYNKMRAWQGAIGVSNHRGIVSPAYIVHKPRISLCMRYYHYLFRTPNMIKEFQKWSYGITSDQWSLRPEHFRLIETIIPPHEEQKQIVRYLDHKNRLINKLIHIKKKQIELLKELKQAIINDAVTGKIDVSTGKPYPKNKDSGVEWLGMIPDGWDPCTIGRLVSFNPSKKEIGVVRDDLLCVFIPMENLSVEGKIICSEKRPYHAIKSGFTYFKKNDVVIAKITPCFENGKSAWLDELTADFGFGTTEFIVMRASEQINGKYLRYIVSSTSFLTTGKQFMRGAAGQKRIPDSFIKDYPIALPIIHTQLQILEYIEVRSNDILFLINNISMKIKQIKDIQTRLISDVVTGKLDIRGLNALKESRTANKYFKRTVLAAEIIDQLHKEPTLGHVKFQKVIYLGERLCELDIETHYYREAAGPHDNRAIRSIDKQLAKLSWYEAKKIDGRFMYVPLSKAGGHKRYFAKYFGHIEKELNRIISILRTLSTERCEMIATLFSAWEDLLSDNNEVMDDSIIYEVTENWTDSKKRISIERWSKCLEWMRENHLTPLNIGRFNAD